MAVPSGESTDPYYRARSEAREAIHLAKDIREFARATRLRVRLRGLIMAWRHRPVVTALVEAERLFLILEAVRDESGAPMGNIQLYDPTAGVLRIRSSSGLNAGFLAYFAEVRNGEGSCGALSQGTGAVVVENVRESRLFSAPAREIMASAGIQAVQSLALSSSRRSFGVISLHYRETGIPLRQQTAFHVLRNDITEAVSLAIRE